MIAGGKKGIKMIISVIDFEANAGKYLDLAASEDIIITRNGKPVSKLTGISPLESLRGIAPDTGISIDDARAERLSKQ